MKKIAFLFAASLAMLSCDNDDNTVAPIEDVAVSFTFTHNWDGAEITNPDYETTSYTNANGEVLTLSKLIYLTSDFTFTNGEGQAFDTGEYNLTNARSGSNTTFTPNMVLAPGDYNVKFTYGFDDEDNAGNYADLNSADGFWTVPDMLGGGYHYMRLEGKYNNSAGVETGFQFHNVRANDNTQTPIRLMDTSIEVDLGTITVEGTSTDIEIEMNVAEWFKNPHQWDLNTNFMILMPKFDIQVMMHENGEGVFSKGAVTSVLP